MPFGRLVFGFKVRREREMNHRPPLFLSLMVRKTFLSTSCLTNLPFHFSVVPLEIWAESLLSVIFIFYFCHLLKGRSQVPTTSRSTLFSFWSVLVSVCQKWTPFPPGMVDGSLKLASAKHSSSLYFMRSLDLGHFLLLHSDIGRLLILLSLRIFLTRSYPCATKSSPAGSCLIEVIRFFNWRCFNLLCNQSRNPVADVQLEVFFRVIEH